MLHGKTGAIPCLGNRLLCALRSLTGRLPDLLENVKTQGVECLWTHFPKTFNTWQVAEGEKKLCQTKEASNLPNKRGQQSWSFTKIQLVQ